MNYERRTHSSRFVDKYELTAKEVARQPIDGIELFSGNIYSFRYNPVTLTRNIPEREKRLPYWDLKPLFLMFDFRVVAGRECLFGVNLHYLLGSDRKNFIQSVRDDKLHDIDRIKLSDLYTNFKYLPVAIRLYYFSHIRSVEKVMDFKTIGNNDTAFEIQYKNMLIDYDPVFKKEGDAPKLTEAHLKQMLNIAKRNGKWWQYSYNVFVKRTHK